MSLELRIRTMSTSPLPNLVEIIPLDPRYEYSAVVELIDVAVSRNSRIKLRAADGSAVVLKVEQLRSLAIRQEH